MRAPMKGICMRADAPAEKTMVASSQMAIDATASSHSRLANGPPSPITLSIDCAPGTRAEHTV